MSNPDNEWTSVVAQALGTIYHQIKDNVDAAIVAYQMATVLDKKNIDAYIVLGEAYYEKGALSDAIDCFCEVIKINPKVEKLYCNLGIALWDKDYTEEAVVAYQKALELNPTYDIVLNNLGVTYLDGIGDTEEAILYFNRALKSNPNYALAHYNKGRNIRLVEKKLKQQKLIKLQ